MKIAVIDKYNSNINYSKYFDFDYDMYHLCDTNIKKVLKKDISEGFLLAFDETEYELDK